MADFELHGYLTTGKFQVNDYTIHIERIDYGVRITVDDGKGNVQSAVVKDGDPEMSAEEIAALRTTYENIIAAYPEWSSAESARNAAETSRASAEGSRQWLYNQTLALYNSLYPNVTNDLASANAAKIAAEAAAANANVNYNSLFYQNGDSIVFGSGTTDGSASLNATGYCSEDKKYIHIKIPVAKFLANINRVEIYKFQAQIMNSGGFGLDSSYVSGGRDYKASIDRGSVTVDKLQNCIHIKMYKGEDGTYFLANNECVNVRIGGCGASAITIQLFNN